MYRKVYKYSVPSLVHLSIEVVYQLWYNLLVVKDNPISTRPVVSPRTNTKEPRQRGKTAQNKTHQKKAKELTDKLKKKASRFDRVSLDRRCYVPNRVRSDNNSIFYHLDDLHVAIANDWKITFKYFYFTPKKNRAYYKKGEYYHASPYALLWSDNNYYLLAYEGGKMKHFRVDKMDGIEIVYQKRDGKEVFKEMKLTERSLRMFAMFSGKVQKVKIRFSNHLANVVIDRFGKDIVMIPDDEKHFTIHTDIEVSPQFFGWVCGLGKAVRILAPAEVVEEMGNYVKGIAEMY